MPGGRDFGILGQSFTLALLAILFAVLLKRFGLEGLLSIGLVALGLSFVIFVHELGHFAIAKWCDVHVETFSLGFGPAIPGCSFRRGETLYKIAWFPLGGYVKMVGEGGEGDDDADDPRSFKNKPVWQRMAIISAGVIMNVLFGVLCFILVYRIHGVERVPAVVESVDAGSPAWRLGVPTSAVIEQIGKIKNPYFDDLQFEVMLSLKGELLPLVYAVPGGPSRALEIEPRLEKEDTRPVIGIAPPLELKLPDKIKGYLHPVRATGAAAQANPPFEFGQTIVGTTDPDQSESLYRPEKVAKLPVDPRYPEGGQGDFFEFRRRLKKLAGKPIIVQVSPPPAPSADGSRAVGSIPTVDIRVPPSYHRALGLRMRMGQITALRDGSPAARAGIIARDNSKGADGDIIKQVEVSDNGRTIRYVSAGKKPSRKGGMEGAARAGSVSDRVAEVEERDLDPVRLPDELEAWAGRNPGERRITLTVVRSGGREPEPKTIPLSWDDRWQFDMEVPQYPASPLAIPGLGLAYKVDTVVDAVDSGSPAHEAGIERGDLIKAIRFERPGKEPGQSVPGEWIDLEYDQWAHAFWGLQDTDFPSVTLRIERAKEIKELALVSQPDTSWPMAERGLILQRELRLQKADGLLDAVRLGMERTERTILTLYLTIRSMFTNRIAIKNALGGPIMIAEVGYAAASEGIYPLLLFLGVISITLAVMNFLPIPVLDGGHMIFLIYEKLRGSPASEPVRTVATFLGLMVIAALMALAFWSDIRRLLW
jgi:regulator of sigma E protease